MRQQKRQELRKRQHAHFAKAPDICRIEHLWGFDHTLAGIIAKGLRAFIKQNHRIGSTPCTYVYPDNDLSIPDVKAAKSPDAYSRWQSDLQKMQCAFEDYYRRDGDFTDAPEAYQRFKEGIQLFADHFHDLWI